MLAKVYKLFKKLINVGEVEVAGEYEVTGFPVVLPEEGVAVFQVIFTIGAISKVPYQ
jgi:hypothetical protein